ncbi:hypothetical protein D7B24_003168 [Verticillium nonalfalfae]|uniref:Insecticide toxin TcdB middle/N-terminal domain-containing protein n=1 Tax=Verticillium nonalfalfae TaxID=1051616 RepID=A0A3M9XWJ6_9PEZI|nr:uncharacterized protein D7B24_003168 [Verticillium nonalfalfae]RNJ52613.1 hypothetical protein D7B24_003168 [Verticillium nonalfalfae]
MAIEGDPGKAAAGAGYGLFGAPAQGSRSAGQDFFDLSTLGSTLSASSALPAAPSIVPQKEGGAISGLGEKYNVSSASGTGSLSVPIQTSPARRGMQPQLALQYDSGAGNSEFGLGWQLRGGASITRKTSKGLPRYHDPASGPESDVFVLSGMEDLVPVFKQDASGVFLQDSAGNPVTEESVRGNHVVRRYFPRSRQTFARIERWTNLESRDDVHWRVVTEENSTLVFGSDANSRIFDQSAAVDGTIRIFSWLQSETYDTYGNAMIFTYKQEDSANVSGEAAHEAFRTPESRGANRYLKTIRYGNTIPNRSLDTWAAFSALELPQDSWKFSVVFDFGEHNESLPSPVEVSAWRSRLDPFSTHRPGFELRTYRLCHRILMFHHFTELGQEPCLVSSMELAYREHPSLTVLASVRHFGHSFDAASGTIISRGLPPLEFSYQEFPLDQELERLTPRAVDEKSLRNLPVGLDGRDYQWIDLDGDGLPGILMRSEAAWYYKRNTSANNVQAGTEPPLAVARFGELELIRTIPSASEPEMCHFGDVTGSGKLNLIQTAPSGWGYFEREADIDTGWTNFRYMARFPNVDASKDSVKMIDLTGDGLPDVLIYEDEVLTWYPSLGEEGYGDGVSVSQPDSDRSSPICLFQDTEQTLYLADMSGDGLADIVRIRNSDVSYWPNYGYGNFGRIVQMDGAPSFDYQDAFHQGRIRLADIDGSGTTDLIYLSGQGLDLYMNHSGNQFSARKRLPPSFPIDNTSVVSVADLLGNGTACLTWSTSLPAERRSIQYIDFTKGRKPHLLNCFVNNLGAETVIRYAPSTKFYLDDKQSGTPWITRLPFPVHCVEQVETIDRVSHSRFAKRYSYHHGYFDGVEREFRGFGRTDEWDTGVFEAAASPRMSNEDAAWHTPPVRTSTWFHTGMFVDERTWSRQIQAEYFADHVREGLPSSPYHGALLPESVNPFDPQEISILRERFRALKGKLLRKEVYSEDGSDSSHIPFAIEEHNYSVKVVQDVQDSHLHAVCTVQPRETASYYMERVAGDPRIHHTMCLDIDDFGSTRKEIKIVYGRQPGLTSLTGPDKAKQESTHILYSENNMTEAIDEGNDFRRPAVYSTRTYEISGFQPAGNAMQFSFADFAGESNDFSPLTSLQEVPFEEDLNLTSRQKRLINKSRTVFRKDDLTGMLPPGHLGKLGLAGESHTLCYTPGLLAKAFSRLRPDGTEEALIRDPKITPGGLVEGSRLGYVDLEGDGSWWASAGTVRYSETSTSDPALELSQAKNRFFEAIAFLDPLGHESRVSYDSYVLLPSWTEDAVGNRTVAEINYRVLKPRIVTDPNGNRTAVAFDAMGMVAGVAIMGKEGSGEGDSLQGFRPDLSQAEINLILSEPKGPTAFDLLGQATRRIINDYGSFRELKTPVPSVAIARVQHTHMPNDRRTVVSISYSDGFGRIIQSKKQAKPGPLIEDGPLVGTRWITSGWVIHDNKGNPVREFEPFFDDTHHFKFDLQAGSSSTLIYDSMSRIVAILRQDHAFFKTVFKGWTESIHDFNDNVLVSNVQNDIDVGHLLRGLEGHEFLPSWYDSRINGQDPLEKATAEKTAAHTNTPRVLHSDALGRVIVQVDDLGSGQTISSRSRFDASNNIIQVSDQLGRLVSAFQFDMRGHRISEASMDAGRHWSLPDVTGQPVLQWDSRDFRLRHVYDAANRPVETWMSDSGANEIMTKQYIYGESASDSLGHNLKNRLHKSRDGSGEMTILDYDFKGNIISTERRLASSYKDTPNWAGAVGLEAPQHSTATFDALDRTVLSVSPDMSQIYMMYDDSGYVDQQFVNVRGESTSLDRSNWSAVITGVDYNAKGLLTSISYGNGTKSKRTYDPLLHRLQGMRTTRAGDPSPLQDLTYTWDPTGNITHVQDKAQQAIFFRNNRVDPSSDYTYDAMYRLVKATGREHLGQTNGRPNNPSAPGPNTGSIVDSPGDGNAMAAYAETYEYDLAGNIMSVAHALSDASRPGWRRTYSYNEPSFLVPGQVGNRLSETKVGSISEAYSYDAGGNMTSMPGLRTMSWDFNGMLRATTKQIVNSGIPETTYYVYDGSGKRVRKMTESRGGEEADSPDPRPIKETIYLDGVEIFRRWARDTNEPTVVRSTVFVDHDGRKVYQADSRIEGTDSSPDKSTRFSLGNNLDSVTMLLDEQARLVSYEEYFPHGSASYQSTANQNEIPKRHRYAGKERDEETGLYYYGARYYAPWLGRWTSPDPAGLADGLNLFCFVRNNPVSSTDSGGQFTMALGLGLAVPAFGEVLAAVVTTVVAVASSPVVITGAIVVGVVVVGAVAYQHYKETKSEPLKFQGPWPVPAPAKPAEPETVPEPKPAPQPAPQPSPETVPQPRPAPKPEPAPAPKPTQGPKPTTPTTKPAPTPRKTPDPKQTPKAKPRPRIQPTNPDKWDRSQPQQHHVFPKESWWFWKAIGINIDEPENVVWMAAWYHLLVVHPGGYNESFKHEIERWVDWDVFDASKGRRLEFREPETGRRLSAGDVRARFEALGAALQLRWFVMGVATPSAVPYLRGWDKVRFGERPHSREEFLRPRNTWGH